METALNPSMEVVTEGQARKMAQQLMPGIVESILDSKLPRDRFQLILTKERQLRIRSRFLKLLRDAAAEVVGMVSIHCNYGECNAVVKAIHHNYFNGAYMNFTSEEIPLVGSGEVDHEVGEFPLKNLRKNPSLKEIQARIAEAGYKSADPLTALNYVAKFPLRQLKYDLVVIFEARSILWHIRFNETMFGAKPHRGIDVDRQMLETGGLRQVRVLVVRP